MKTPLKSISLISMALAATFVSSQSMAVEGLSANVGVTSNYLWRGVTQSNDAAAVSGGIDYASKSGFYVGTWASNVDFGDAASYELDFYLGYSTELSNGIGYDIGYIYYAYPDSDKVDSNNQYDFGEVYGNLSYSYFTLSANYGVNNDDGASWADKALYLSAAAEFEVADGLTLALHVGQYNFDEAGSEDYVDYGASLSKGGFTFGISDTDMHNDDVKVFVSYAVDIDL